MKRHLPLVVIIVLSFFVFACTLGAVYILSVDAKTPAEKIQSITALGLPSAAALLVLLWFGAGMDQVLSRLKQRSTRISVSLLTYLVVPVFLCIGLPALAGFVIYSMFNAPKGWQQFPAPPQPAAEIVSANGTSVVIRTESGSQWYCVIGSSNWKPVAEIDPLYLSDSTETSALPSFDPPDGTVSLRGVSTQNMGVEERTYYAVVGDGSVWYLQQDNNKYEAGFASGLFLTIALIPAIAGLLVIYLGAGVSALARRMAA